MKLSIFSAALAVGSLALLGLAPRPASAQTAVSPSFEESAYLYDQAYDTLYGGDGQWRKYQSWLNAPQLGAETDGGTTPDDWWGSCEMAGWNFPWGTQQSQVYAAAAMPDILLGDWQMPFLSSGQYDQTWALEAANDPATMQHFVQFAENVNLSAGTNNHYSGSYTSTAPTSIIVRLGYEFDGGWNPYGNLNVRANMPNNYIQSWRNIVTTVRAHDPKHIIKFCWNPTDTNVQINVDQYYPGDAWVDYIGLDTYDKAYTGDYTQGTQPSAAQQATVWNNIIAPHLLYFTNLAATHNKPLIVGEWGLWDINSAPGGGDDPDYVQRMYNWMTTNKVTMECYFEYASDGDHQLWPGGDPNNPRATAFPKAAAKYRDLFGVSASYGTMASLPGTVQATSYDTGGQGIAYNETINGSQTGFRSDNSSADYGPGIGWTTAGQWYKYTVNVATAGTYTLKCSVEAPSSGGSFHLENKSGQNLTGSISCPATDGWSTLGTATASLTLPAGPQVLKWVQDTGGYNLLSMAFTSTTAGFGTGYYYLVSRATGQVVDVPGFSKAEPVRLGEYTKNGGSNQQWKLTQVPAGDGSAAVVYSITNLNSGYGFDAASGGTTNGTAVNQYQYLGYTNQQWQLVPTDSGYYTVYNYHANPSGASTGECLDVDTGTNLLQLYQNLGYSNQQWKLVTAP